MDARVRHRRRGGGNRLVSLAYAYALPQAGWPSMLYSQEDTAAALQDAGLGGGFTVFGGVERPQVAGAVVVYMDRVEGALDRPEVRNLLKSLRPVRGHQGHAEWLAGVA